jgi:predicted HAD superfamily phosphohydrolase YqeG
LNRRLRVQEHRTGQLGWRRRGERLRLTPPAAADLTCTDFAPLLQAVAADAYLTLIIDIEPIVARWNAPSAAFTRGAVAFQEGVRYHARTVRHVVFASNADRPRPTLRAVPGLHTHVIPSARKPWRIDYLSSLPPPVAVVGDQLLTDGLLAWRIGARFFHWQPVGPMPWWPKLQSVAGRILAQVFFREYTVRGSVGDDTQ